MRTTHRILDVSPSRAQLDGMRDASRYSTESDRDLDEFIAFMVGLRVPFGEEPLSYRHFDDLEQYLSAFYQARMSAVRSKLQSDMEYYKDAYIRESEKIAKLSAGRVTITTGGGPYPKGGTFVVPKKSGRAKSRKAAK